MGEEDLATPASRMRKLSFGSDCGYGRLLRFLKFGHVEIYQVAPLLSRTPREYDVVLAYIPM
jgi:hypothetical protein